MTEEDFKTVENFKEKMAKKVYTSIKSQIEKSSLSVIAAASNIFGRGFGEKKIEKILNSAPDIITSKYTLEEKIEIVKNIDSMASKTAKQFVEKIPEFIEFMEEAKLMSKLISKIDLEVDSDKTQHELYKKK